MSPRFLWLLIATGCNRGFARRSGFSMVAGNPGRQAGKFAL